jgi:high-affinity Fe2+/Pb2+ permease
MRPEIRWVIGVLVGLTAMVGLMILVVLVSLALEPPAWVQMLIGVILVALACLLTWLVASALGQRDRAHAGQDEGDARRRPSQGSREPTSR